MTAINMLYLTMCVQLDFVEEMAAGLLAHVFMHHLWSVLRQRQRVRQRLTGRLQREQRVCVSNTVSATQHHKYRHTYT